MPARPENRNVWQAQMRHSPFSSTQQFRQAFVRGLEGLLEQPELGSYILVHANASFDPKVGASLERRLRRQYLALSDSYRDALRQGRTLTGALDDLLVFLKLMAIDFDGVQPTERRRAGPWEVQFNHLRAFRPPRMSAEPVTGNYAPFEPEGFHFNKPFLRREVLWSGQLHRVEVELLYNKFPFVDLHGLLVPDRGANQPQFLSRPYHLYVWELARQLGVGLPGLGFGYNSYGAYASVNHLHFQMFVRERPLPIADPVWRHNGGDREYPTGCERFDCPREAWERISQLHAERNSYNLVYLPGLMYCLPRRRQGSYTHAPWTAGFAWYELAGGVTAFNRDDFAIDAEVITRELAKLRL